ncbi:replication initiation protein RepC [uncultured Roseobacter sp.]|uniref:replication initiation protein RepC n=1 Tax=uncultured Roseobacter sp. TaxID=114847 RepID=UPI0026198A82|nr:replication initiation protein RepC [uncultured Roseobacter sp.]
MSATLSHCGLPAGIERSKFIGRIKLALKARGLKTSAIVYLSKAFDNWTRDQDYEPGRICGFWHQVSGLAEEMTCTERTVHSIERDLVDAELISRHPKANGRRDGLRDSGGEKTLRKVFGINLAPIIEQAAELLAEAEAIRLHKDAIESCRSEIREINRQIRQLDCPEALHEAHSILPEGRTVAVKNLVALQQIRDALSAVEEAFKTDPRSEEISDSGEDFDIPIVQTKQPKFLYQPCAVSEHVTIQQAITLAAEPFRECLEMYGDYTWRGVTNAAYEIAREMGIDDRSWAAACSRAALGPERAAICIILIHRNLYFSKDEKHVPRSPAACLGGMAKKARNGTLNLIGFIHAVRKQPMEWAKNSQCLTVKSSSRMRPTI